MSQWTIIAIDIVAIFMTVAIDCRLINPTHYPVPLGLPALVYFTEEGSQPTLDSTDDRVDTYPQSCYPHQSPWDLLPFIDFQPRSDPAYDKSSINAADNTEQIEIQRKANPIAEEANRLQLNHKGRPPSFSITSSSHFSSNGMTVVASGEPSWSQKFVCK